MCVQVKNSFKLSEAAKKPPQKPKKPAAKKASTKVVNLNHMTQMSESNCMFFQTAKSYSLLAMQSTLNFGQATGV